MVVGVVVVGSEEQSSARLRIIFFSRLFRLINDSPLLVDEQLMIIDQLFPLPGALPLERHTGRQRLFLDHSPGANGSNCWRREEERSFLITFFVFKESDDSEITFRCQLQLFNEDD